MICPICKGDLLGRARCSSSYCEGYRDGRDETEWRAMLERDVAEVERHARSLRDALRVAPISAADHARQLLVALDLVDCRAWLTRAKAALG